MYLDNMKMGYFYTYSQT